MIGTQPPCRDEKITEKLNITKICNFTKVVTKNKIAFLKLMKFKKQFPTKYENENEYNSIFKKANTTLAKGRIWNSSQFLTRSDILQGQALIRGVKKLLTRGVC